MIRGTFSLSGRWTWGREKDYLLEMGSWIWSQNKLKEHNCSKLFSTQILSDCGMLSFLPPFPFYETLRVNACNVSLDICTFQQTASPSRNNGGQDCKRMSRLMLHCQLFCTCHTFKSNFAHETPCEKCYAVQNLQIKIPMCFWGRWGRVRSLRT